MQPHVLIAGGGIGGLTAALALLRSGCDVDVYEQAAELKEVGAGLQLAANGTRVLHELGIGEILAPSRSSATGIPTSPCTGQISSACWRLRYGAKSPTPSTWVQSAAP